MKIVIAGGTGFLGSELKTYFEKQDFEVLILTRKPRSTGEIFWDGVSRGDWCDKIEGVHWIINLCGKSVDCRYTPENKEAILRSRIEPTRALGDYVKLSRKKPLVWCNASSATIYVHAETQLMTEQTGIIGDDFSMNVCKQWEKTFFEATEGDLRKVALRSSIVMGKNGGAYPKLKMLTRLGLGGQQGNGEQGVSWIHVEDFCRSVQFICENANLDGPVNITSPEVVTNQNFMAGLRHSLKVPFGLPQPQALLEVGAAIIRTETELLLKSRRVYPEKLRSEGFSFLYSQWRDALSELTG